jgi:hypothetical protein
MMATWTAWAQDKAAIEQPAHARSSETNHRSSPAGLSKPNRAKQLPMSRQRSQPGKALHQPGPTQPVVVAKVGLIPNAPAQNALPGRMPGVVALPTALSLNNVRHRGPNPAVVGGSPSPRRSNTGVVNGNRMNYKR